MPNYYAHLTFGRRVLERLPAPLRPSLAPEWEAFRLGCLGPDPLFFHRVPWPSAPRREGLAIHDRSALPAVERLQRAVEADVPLVRGYSAGFLCHLVLDSACHGYINRRAEAGPVTHSAMEGEFDRLLMEADGLDFMGGEHLPLVTCPAVWTAAAAAYRQVSPGEMERAYRSMRRYTGLLVRGYGRPLGRVLDAAARLPGCGSLRGVALRRAPDPNCAESNAVLLERLESTVPDAAEQVAGFFAAAAEDRPVSAWFDRDLKGTVPSFG